MTNPKSNTVTIELDLAHLFYGSELRGDEEIPTPFLNGVIKEVARIYMQENGANFRDAVDREIRANIKDEAARLIGTAITQTLQPTDYYGRPSGAPRSLESVIVEESVKYLKSSEGYGRESVNPVQKFIREEVRRRFAAELGEAMKEAKAQVIAAVKEEGAKVLSQTIANMAGIR